MNEKLKAILQKNVAELEAADIAELKASINELTEDQKSKFAKVLESQEDEESESDLPDELEVKASYDAKLKIAVASTDVIDRHGERIDQTGWELKNFKKNPVLLWGHDHSEIAVGNARNIHIDKKSGTPRLVFTPDFHDKTDKAKALKSLFEEGWLNSFSVGFMPKEFNGKDSTYLKQELLEISAVNVPANPEAVMMSYKSLISKGFKKSIAEDVTGVEEDKDGKVRVRISERGAVADEINAEEVWEQKMANMSDARDIWWAFCNVYYEEETAADEFSKLLQETVDLLGKVLDGTYESPNDDEGGDGEEAVEESAQMKKVLDRFSTIDKYEDKINELTSLVETLVKAQENKATSAAPTVPKEKEVRAKRSLTKVISKAADQLLADEKQSSTNKDSTEMLKVIKRASEILNKAQK